MDRPGGWSGDWLVHRGHQPRQSPKNHTSVVVVVVVVRAADHGCSQAFIFQCWPLSIAWSWSPHGHCNVRVYTLQFVSSIVHLVVDVVVLMLPLFVVSRLQINVRRKGECDPLVLTVQALRSLMVCAT